MNDPSGQTELDLSSPDQEPVTPGPDSGNLGAVQKPVEGSASMGGDSKRDPTTLAPDKLTPHELAQEIARLVSSREEADRARLSALRAANEKLLQLGQEQAGFMAVSQPPEAVSVSDEARRRQEELERAEKRFKGKQPHWNPD